MAQRLFVGLLVLAAVVWAQRRVDPRNTYNRVICVVPIIGKGTPADPRRPQYAPWPPAQDETGIIAFSYQPSDDGRLALVEFVARDRAAFQAIFNDKSIGAIFEKGRHPKDDIEKELRKYKKDFDVDKFGTVMP